MAAPAIISFRKLGSRFFDGLTPDEINTLSLAGRHRTYSAGSTVLHQGHPAEHLFLLTSGRCRHFDVLPDGRKLILFWIPPGELFGGAALLSRGTDYLLGTEAVNKSTVLVWHRSTIRRLVADHPRLYENLLLMAFDYLSAYRAAHLALITQSAAQRLARVLAHLAMGFGRRVAGGIELDVHNEELANEANVTAFTTSRLMRDWQRHGILQKRRGKVLLRSPERLLLLHEA